MIELVEGPNEKTISLTPITGAVATLEGSVDLQGRPETEVTIRLLQPGTGIELRNVSTITADNGLFTVTDIVPGTYDVCVKGYTSLSILKANQVFTEGNPTSINFGILIEGDANGDDWITMADEVLLEGSWNSSPGNPNWNPKCDFNRDGWISSVDSNLMCSNWGQHGDCAVPLVGSIGPGQIWYEGLTDWEVIVSGREIPMNMDISLATSWINELETNAVGNIHLAILCPDGAIITPVAVLNQDMEAPPGQGWTVEFEPFTTSLQGTYTATATFSSFGQLASVTFNLVVGLMPQPGYATLYGYVTGGYPSAPLQGALVWEGWYGANSNIDGYYVLNKARECQGREMVCTADGYLEAYKTVSLDIGEIRRLDFHLDVG